MATPLYIIARNDCGDLDSALRDEPERKISPHQEYIKVYVDRQKARNAWSRLATELKLIYTIKEVKMTVHEDYVAERQIARLRNTTGGVGMQVVFNSGNR